MAAFVEFARTEGTVIPDTPEDRARLGHALLARVIRARFGPEALYRFLARSDPEVAAARERLDDAGQLLRPGG